MPPRRSSGRLSKGRNSTDNAASQPEASTTPLTNGNRVTRSRRSVENSHAAAVADTEIPDAPLLEIPPAKPSARRTSNRGRKSKEAAAADAVAMPPPPPRPPAPSDGVAQPSSSSTSSEPSLPQHPGTTAPSLTNSAPLAPSSSPSSSRTTAAAAAASTSTAASTRGGRTEGVRFKYVRAPAMKNAFKKALRASTKNVTYDNFAPCFPTYSRHDPEGLRQVHSQFLNLFNNELEDQWSALNEQREIFSRLDDVDRLVQEARLRRANAPPGSTPPGDTPIDKPPPTLIAAHLVPLLEEQEAILRVQLEAKNESMEALMRQKEAQEKELQALLRTLQAQAGVVAETAESVKELGNLEDIEKEADKMDEGGT